MISTKQQRAEESQLAQIHKEMLMHLKHLSKKELIRTVMGQVDLILQLRNIANDLKKENETLKAPQSDEQKAQV
jgi:hypothetical protein